MASIKDTAMQFFDACETGKGYTTDPARAAELYTRCGLDNLYACKGLARLAIRHGVAIPEITAVASALETAAAAGDAEACWCLAYLHETGSAGAPADSAKARALVDAACRLKSEQACAALSQTQLPPYANFQRRSVPGWSSAYGGP